MKKILVGVVAASTAFGAMTTTADAIVDQVLGMAHGAYQAHRAQRDYQRYNNGGRYYGHPGYGRPGYGSHPGYGRPGYGPHPGYGHPVYGHPGYGHPGYAHGAYPHY